MALRNFRPLTPTLRFKSLPMFQEVTKSQSKPVKSLTEPKKRSGGRNNNGRLTSRHIGGGHKQKYRKVDFKRKKRGIAADVMAIEYDPNRTARIALLKYSDGEQSYILAPDGLEVGAKVTAGEDAPPKVGNALPLRAIPLGANIHCIEIMPGRGGQIARSAGQQATLSNREGGYALVKLPSGEIRRIHDSAYATIGQVGNVDHMNVSSGALAVVGGERVEDGEPDDRARDGPLCRRRQPAGGRLRLQRVVQRAALLRGAARRLRDVGARAHTDRCAFRAGATGARLVRGLILGAACKEQTDRRGDHEEHDSHPAFRGCSFHGTPLGCGAAECGFAPVTSTP